MKRITVEVKRGPYDLLAGSLETGIRGGINKYFKYRDGFDPSREEDMAAMADQIAHYFFLALDEDGIQLK